MTGFSFRDVWGCIAAPRWTPRRRAAAAGALTGLILLTSLLLASAPEKPVLCLFRLATGLPCPSCGMTRGFIALSHGDIALAAKYNVAAPVIHAAVSVIFLLSLLQLFSGRDWLLRFWQRFRIPLAVLVVVLLIIAWAVNLALME